MARGFLESQGIPAVVFDENIVWMNWLYSTAVGGVKVKVPPGFYRQAKQLLEQDFSSLLSELSESDIPKAPGDACPRCRSERVSPNTYSPWWIIPTFFFMLPVFYRYRQYKCDVCGFKWRGLD